MALDVGLVANLATAAAVLVALAVGLAQIRQSERKRRDAAAVELIHALQSPDHIRAVHRLILLPDDADPALLRAAPDLEQAFFVVDHVYESIGVLVHEGVLPLHLYDDLYGATTRKLWRKTRRYAEGQRRDLAHPNYAEWFQWLAEQLEAHPVAGKELGAHVAHKAWAP
jgi:hypothetical protein